MYSRFNLNRFAEILLLLFCNLILAYSSTANDFSSVSSKESYIRVLVLSGQNNHEWHKTTPAIVRILEDSKLADVTLTEKPDTLSYASLHRYNVIISNWNAWPDTSSRLFSKWENDLLRYVKEGGGFIAFHAGACSFYSWNDYHDIGIGRWGKTTKHGPRTKGYAFNLDQNHPVTKGLASFYLMDEIWENTDVSSKATALGMVKATSEKDGHPILEPAIFVAQMGKGRCFYTALGHDERALLNSGLKTLLLRAAQWCAGRDVTVEVPSDLKIKQETADSKLRWTKTDTTLALINHSEIVWQFNFNNRFGKPYFHPLMANETALTCVSPVDHPWHLGLWFSWKYINGVNYWEYDKKFSTPKNSYQAEGSTVITHIKQKLNRDFTADIQLDIRYHPHDGKDVLTEDRRFFISKPMSDGRYYIDESHVFTALEDHVLLDRTPLQGEPHGQSWGGYAGVSARFNQDFTTPEISASSDSLHLNKSNWMYMGFNNVIGKKVGMLILTDPKFSTSSTSWYVIRDPQIPFYYYSPAALFDHSLELQKGEKVNLKYRIWILPGLISKADFQEKYLNYIHH